MTSDRAYFDQLFTFVHGLALRTGAGAPLADALDALAASAGGPVWREGIAFLRSRVDEGERLSEAIWQRSDLFPYLLGVLVRWGEVQSGLDRALRRYAEYLRKELELAALAVPGGEVPGAQCPVPGPTGTLSAEPGTGH